MGCFTDPGEFGGRVVETGTTSKIYPENGASKKQLKRFDENMVKTIKKFGPPATNRPTKLIKGLGKQITDERIE